MGEGIMARQRIELQADEAGELRRRLRASTVSVRDRRRSEIILLSTEGLTQQQIAERMGISRLQVNRWVGRFATERLAGLSDAPGRGRKPWLADGAAKQVVEQAVTPPPHLGRWSCRTMARAVGISAASVQRLWAANDIKPHLSRTFKLSNDKQFEEKFWDVIGLYLDPPEKALVLCCDEKSQCQALERTQPGLPLGIGDGACQQRPENGRIDGAHEPMSSAADQSQGHGVRDVGANDPRRRKPRIEDDQRRHADGSGTDRRY